MGWNRLLFKTIALLASLFLTSCQPNSQGNSDLQTVNNHPSAYRAQGNLGICWAHAFTSFLEDEMLARSQVKIELSAEALGLLKMQKSLTFIIQIMQESPEGTVDILRRLKTDEADRRIRLRTTAQFIEDSLTGGNWDLAADIVESQGAIERRVWDVGQLFIVDPMLKFDNKYVKFLERFAQRIAKLPPKGTDPDLLAREILDDALASAGVPKFPWTPNDNNRVKTIFNSNSYALIDAGKAGVENFVNEIKKALAKGQNVPLNLLLNEKFLSGSYFKFRNTINNGSLIEGGYGHAVLATDFINQGSKRGAMKSSEVEAEMAKPISMLNGLIVKNSYDNTTPGKLLPKGFYEIDLAYLTKALAGSQAVVRIEIADNAHAVAWKKSNSSENATATSTK